MDDWKMYLISKHNLLKGSSFFENNFSNWLAFSRAVEQANKRINFQKEECDTFYLAYEDNFIFKIIWLGLIAYQIPNVTLNYRRYMYL